MMTACVGSTPEFQPEIVPSSVTNRKRAVLPGTSSKPVVPLKTVPVGTPGSLPVAGGTVTTSDCATPAPLYRVESPVPLSAAHHGVVELRERPQGLTRFGSVNVAMPDWSETRFACV